MGIPVIDLDGFVGGDADHRRRLGVATDRACRDVGFFSVVGHGIPDDVIDAAHARALDFFDLPEGDRLAVAMPEPGYPYGYNPFLAESLNRSRGGGGPPPPATGSTTRRETGCSRRGNQARAWRPRGGRPRADRRSRAHERVRRR
ncbi:MAG: 2-oxoglutarate and iron-dependent oxygenase domain-containing protein [Ilumatobacter sp.]|uniref:2-oxoglutarate and iron-dependent oxygenase domain-containing protein n=1 Tax=Ilumatobacter sp. TaxID=1967498 RepID=UPI003919CE8C